MDSDHTLELLIKTKADLAAAKGVAAELERSILRAKLLGQSFAQQEAQLKKVNGEIAAYTQKTGEGGKQTKLFEGHMGEVKKSIRELSREFPLAADALRLLTNPVGGALAIGISMFALAKQKLDEWNKSLDEQGEIARKADFAEGIKSRKDALESGALAGEMYRDKMAHLLDEEELFQRALKSEIALLHARNEAASAVSDAQKGLAEAQIKHANSLQEAALTKMLEDGKISAAQFNQAKLTLDASYFAALTALEEKHEQEKLARESKARQDEIALLEKAIDRSSDVQSDLNEEAAKARAKATASAATQAGIEARAKEGESARDADAKAVHEAEEAIKGHGKLFGIGHELTEGELRGFAAGPDKQIAAEAAKLLKSLDDARGNQERHQHEIQEGFERGPQAKSEAALDQAAAERAEGRAEANVGRSRELAQQILDAQQAAREKDKAATGVSGADAQKRLLEFRDKEGGASIGGGKTVADETRYDELVHLRATGHKLNSEQQAFVKNFGEFIRNQLAWHTQIGPLLLKNAVESAKLNGDQAAILQNVLKEQEIIKARLKGLNLK